LGSRDVIGRMTIRLPGVDFLFVVNGDHASIRHNYGDMVPRMLDVRTYGKKKGRKERKKGREMGRKGKKEIGREKKGKKKERRKGRGKGT